MLSRMHMYARIVRRVASPDGCACVARISSVRVSTSGGLCVARGSVLAAMQLEWPRYDSRVVTECTVYTELLAAGDAAAVAGAATAAATADAIAGADGTDDGGGDFNDDGREAR